MTDTAEVRGELAKRFLEMQQKVSRLRSIKTEMELEIETLREGRDAAQAVRCEAVEELAGRVAHNFSNLVQVVMAGAHLALTNLEVGNVAEAKSNLEQVLESCRFGADTVRHLQYYAIQQLDNRPSEGRVFDLSRAVEQALGTSNLLKTIQPERAGVKVSLNRSLTPGCFVRGKENELLEALANLVENAAEALRGDGEIRVTTFKEGDEVCFEVQDNGVGIPEQNRERAFEPFWTTKGLKGAGMGLTTSCGIIRRHQGDITLHSTQGKGSTVTVRLPIAAESFGPGEHAEDSRSDKPLKILVIDDMRPVLWALRDELTRMGQTVFTASSGPEGLEIFKSIRIDAVVCDLGMPAMNGWEVGAEIREICREKGIPKTPFILLTGWGGQMAEKQRIAESRVAQIVEKPVDIADLLEVVRRQLRG